MASIIRNQLGPMMEPILLLGTAFAMFGAGMVLMVAAASRMACAMAPAVVALAVPQPLSWGRPCSTAESKSESSPLW